MKKILCLIIIISISSCKRKADVYNLNQNISEDEYKQLEDSAKYSNVSPPDSEFIYNTTTATINKDTVYSSVK